MVWLVLLGLLQIANYCYKLSSKANKEFLWAELLENQVLMSIS